MQPLRRPFRRGGRLSLSLAVCSIAAVLGLASPALGQDAPAPSLKHGVNLSNWFASSARQPLTPRDFTQIKAAGFDHVRLPVDPESLGFSLSEGSTGRVLFDFSDLDEAINQTRENGLSIILDIHPGDSFMMAMEQDPRAGAGLIALWKHLAEHYKPYSTGTVVYELLNEPRFAGDPAAYKGLITDAVAAIRQAGARNTIIVDVPKSAALEGFDGFTPVKDERVIYGFHFYEPYLFTHQGMKGPSAKGRAVRYFHNLPYPSGTVDPNTNYAPGASDPIDAKRVLTDYVSGKWDAGQIAARIKIAADWAAANHVQVICTEFGAGRKFVAPAARYQWIADTRKALDTANIGWDLWDYTDLFGITKLTGETVTDSLDGSIRLADPTQGTRDIEPDAAKALFGG